MFENLYRMFLVIIIRCLSLVAVSLKCYHHVGEAHTLKTCPADKTMCTWGTGTGIIGNTGDCTASTTFSVTKLPIIANQCVKLLGTVGRTECYCNTDGCNKKCTASECKAVAAGVARFGIGDGLNNIGDGIRAGLNNLVDGANSSIQNATSAVEKYETCVAKCDGTKMVSSIIFVASQAMLGFLILNMKMTE